MQNPEIQNLDYLSVPPEIWVFVGEYISLLDLFRFGINCKALYETNSLGPAFQDKLNGLPIIPSQEDSVSETENSQMQAKKRIQDWMSLCERDEDKEIIKKWFLLDEFQFKKQSQLFVGKTIKLEIKRFEFWKPDVFEFYSAVGANDMLKTLWRFMGDELENSAASKCEMLKGSNLVAFREAAEKGNISVLKTLWGFAGEVADSEKLKRKVLESSGSLDVFKSAAEGGCVEVLQVLWDFAGEFSDSDELKRQMLTGGDFIVFQMVAKYGCVDAFQKLLDFVEGFSDSEKLKDQMLIANDYFVFTKGAESGCVAMLQVLWGLAKERDISEKLRRQMLIKTFCSAHINAIQTLWDFAGELSDSDILKSKMLERHNYIVLRRYAEGDENVSTFQKLWDLLGELADSEKIKQSWLESNCMNFFKVAAYNAQSEVLDMFWNFVGEYPGQHQFKRLLLADVPEEGWLGFVFESLRLALYVSESRGRFSRQMFQTLQNDNEIKTVDELLQKGADPNYCSNGRSIFDLAISIGNIKLARYLYKQGARSAGTLSLNVQPDNEECSPSLKRLTVKHI